MIVFDLQLPSTSEVKVLFGVADAQFLLKTYMSGNWFEELGLVVSSGAHVHVRVHSNCQKTIISLNGCAELELRRVWTVRDRAL